MTTDRTFKQLYFLLFAPFALQVTFLNLYFERRGLTYAEIGTVQAVGTALAILSPLLWGQVADQLGRKRRILQLLGLGTVILFPLHWLARGALVFALLAAAMSFCRSPLIPLTDALCLDHLHRTGDPGGSRYGPVRLWGSVGFIVSSLLFPLLLAPEATSDPLARLAPVFVCYPLLAGLLLFRARSLPDDGRERPHEAPRVDLRAVLALPRMKRVSLLITASWIANSAYYLYLSLYLDAIGVPDKLKGLFWSVAVLAEVVLMAVGRPMLARCGVRGLLLLGFSAQAVRALAFSRALPPALVLVAVMPLHAFAFGAVHVGTIAFLSRRVPVHLRASGQTLLASLGGGVGQAIGCLVAGWVSELVGEGTPAGLHAAFLVSGVVQLVVVAAAWRWLPRSDDEGLPVEQPL